MSAALLEFLYMDVLELLLLKIGAGIQARNVASILLVTVIEQRKSADTRGWRSGIVAGSSVVLREKGSASRDSIGVSAHGWMVVVGGVRVNRTIHDVLQDREVRGWGEHRR